MSFKLDNASIVYSKLRDEDSSSASSLAVEQNIKVNFKRSREKVTLSHILTNTIILYEFILELSALVQVRGSFFGKTGYL
jgi:hypothetical protein